VTIGSIYFATEKKPGSTGKNIFLFFQELPAASHFLQKVFLPLLYLLWQLRHISYGNAGIVT
jgi:hypothetical protein